MLNVCKVNNLNVKETNFCYIAIYIRSCQVHAKVKVRAIFMSKVTKFMIHATTKKFMKIVKSMNFVHA